MPNAYGAPETDVHTVSKKIAAGEPFVLLDVREAEELKRANLTCSQNIFAPLSRLAQLQIDGLPEDARDTEAEIVVMCHHGVRSAQVTAWLLHNGWTNVVSLAGGIDAYAREVDPSVGLY